MRLVRDTIAFTAAEMPKVELDLSLGVSHRRGRVDGRQKSSPSHWANGFAYVETRAQAVCLGR